MHAVVRNCGGRIGWRDDKVEVGLLPVLPPLSLESFSSANESPVLSRGGAVPVAKQASPQSIATDISDPEVVHVLDRSRKLCVESHLSDTTVVPFAGPEESANGIKTISAQEARGQVKSFIGFGWVDLDNFVPGPAKSGLCHLQCSLASRARVDNAICSHDTDSHGLLFLVLRHNVRSPGDGMT